MFESIINTPSDFHFIRPWWLLAVTPLGLLGAWLLLTRTRNKPWSEVIDADLLTHLLDVPANTRAAVKKRWPVYVVALAWLISCFALAGPSWQRLPQIVEKKADVMVVIVDMTLSMYATDVTPSRLLRARYKLLELLARRKEGQTALIAYSGSAHIVSPLTDDSKTIAALVPALSPEVMPSIGSNAGAAFDIAADLIAASGSTSARIVWLTDELLNKDRSHIESVVARYSVDLVTLGIGSKQGGLIKLPDGKFIKDNDRKLITAKLNRTALQQFIAEQGGRYIDLRTDNSDVEYLLSESLFDSGNLALDKVRDNQRTVERWRDQGAWLALLLIPMVLLSFRRGWLLSITCCAVLIAPHDAYAQTWATTWQDLWLTQDQQAAKLLQQGNADQAAELFNNSQWQGVANFKAGKYAESTNNLKGIDNANAHYNRGHALAHDGKLDAAIAAYDSALALSPNMVDAKTSKSLLEQMLKQQEEQQGQQGENSDEQQESSESGQPSEQQGSNSDQQSDDESAQQSQSPQESDERNKADQAQQHADEDTAQEENKAEERSAKTESEPELDGEDTPDTVPPLSEAEQLSAQKSQALQQWLRQIPDDPAGLLRRKFQYERQLKQREGTVIDAEEDGQIW